MLLYSFHCDVKTAAANFVKAFQGRKLQRSQLNATLHSLHFALPLQEMFIHESYNAAFETVFEIFMSISIHNPNRNEQEQKIKVR